MITPQMRVDNCLSDLTAGDFTSGAFTSDLENIVQTLYKIGKNYEGSRLLITYGRLLECPKKKQCKVIESLKLFLSETRSSL